MRWLALAALFVFAFLVFAAASAPLSPILRLLKAPERGLAWVAASGTIWRGEIAGLRVAYQDVGDLSIETDPWALAGLGVVSSVRTRGPITIRGELRAGFDGSISAQTVTAAIDVARWRGARPELARSGGEVFVSIDRLVLERSGACVEAEGRARTDMLARLAAAQADAWVGPTLEGPLRCEAGALALDLTGASEAGAVEVAVTLDASARTATVAAQATSKAPQAAFSLGLLGFVETEPGRFSFERRYP